MHADHVDSTSTTIPFVALRSALTPTLSAVDVTAVSLSGVTMTCRSYVSTVMNVWVVPYVMVMVLEIGMTPFAPPDVRSLIEINSSQPLYHSQPTKYGNGTI